MENIFIPSHQFEIRFTEILDYSKLKSTINPFAKIASNVQIQNENTHFERTIFVFQDISAQIHVFWDRIMFTIEGSEFKSPDKNEFIIKTFFKIFETLKKSELFGVVKNILYFKILLKEIKDEPEVCKTISEKNISSSFRSIFPGFNDLGIYTEYEYKNAQVFFNYGNYKGLNDLKRRNINIGNLEVVKKASFTGEMIEFKYHDITANVSLTNYIDIVKYEMSQVEKLWQK